MRTKASILAVKAKRLQLPVARRPRIESLGDGISLGYRRNRAVGTWVVRKADGRGRSCQRVIGLADDWEDADGHRVLTWAQAQARALTGTPRGRQRPMTVRDAIAHYRADILVRNGDHGNVSRLRKHVSPALLGSAADKAPPFRPAGVAR